MILEESWFRLFSRQVSYRANANQGVLCPLGFGLPHSSKRHSLPQDQRRRSATFWRGQDPAPRQETHQHAPLTARPLTRRTAPCCQSTNESALNASFRMFGPGTKRTLRLGAVMSATDPKQTSGCRDLESARSQALCTWPNPVAECGSYPRRLQVRPSAWPRQPS